MKLIRGIAAAGLASSALLVSGLSLAAATASAAAPTTTVAANIVEYGGAGLGATAIGHAHVAPVGGVTAIEY